MPKAKREKNCSMCGDDGLVRMSFMVCDQCSRHFCSRHGDSKMDECTPCLDGGEEM
jgi:ribosomal protein S14